MIPAAAASMRILLATFGRGNATMSVDTGSHQFQTPVSFLSATDIEVLGPATLTFNNDVSLDANVDAAVEGSLVFNSPLDVGANTLTKTGGGTMNVNNTVTGSGGVVGASGIIGGIGTCPFNPLRLLREKVGSLRLKFSPRLRSENAEHRMILDNIENTAWFEIVGDDLFSPSFYVWQPM